MFSRSMQNADTIKCLFSSPETVPLWQYFSKHLSSLTLMGPSPQAAWTFPKVSISLKSPRQDSLSRLSMKQ